MFGTLFLVLPGFVWVKIQWSEPFVFRGNPVSVHLFGEEIRCRFIFSGKNDGNRSVPSWFQLYSRQIG